MVHRGGFLLLVSCVAATAAFAQEVPQAFTGARIIPVEGEPIDAGTLVVEAGVIKALGSAGKVEIPATAKRFDLKGKGHFGPGQKPHFAPAFFEIPRGRLENWRFEQLKDRLSGRDPTPEELRRFGEEVREALNTQRETTG